MKTWFCFVVVCVSFLKAKDIPIDSVYHLVRFGSIGQARQVVLEKLSANPEKTELLLLAAKLSFNQDDFYSYYQQIIDQEEKNTFQEEALYRMGQFYYAQENYIKSLELFRRLLKMYPDGNWVTLCLYWSGYSTLNQKKPLLSDNLETAKSYFTKLLTSTPSQNIYQSLALVGLADVAAYKKDSERVLELIDIALESLVPSFAPSFYVLGYLNGKGQVKEKYQKKLSQDYPESFEKKWLEQLNLSDSNTDLESSKKIKSVTFSKISLYFIQIGFFSKITNAKRLLKRNQNESLLLHIEKVVLKGKKFFIVRSKGFTSKARATQKAQEYLKPRKISYHIRK